MFCIWHILDHVPPSNTSEPKGCCKHPRYRGKLGKDWVNIEMYPLVN